MSPAGGSARFTRAALADLREAAGWIAQDNLVAADALRVAANRAALMLGEHPRAGSVRTDIAPERFRFLVLRGFPYVLVYEADLRPPRILRVLHGARDLHGMLALLRD